MSPDLLTPPGQGDDGRADSGLLAALRSGDRDALTAALPGARVFVGVEANLLSADTVTGADKVSEMALVTLRTPSGSGALPVFTAVDVMAAWRPSVRPVPVTLPDACAEAVRMGLAAVVIDLGGPSPVTLDVRSAAAGSGGGGRDARPFVGDAGMWISAGGPVPAAGGGATPGNPAAEDPAAASSVGGPVAGGPVAGGSAVGGPAVGGAAAGGSVAGAAARVAAGGGDPGLVPEAGGGLLRPRPTPLGFRPRRRIRAALAGLPAGTEVWPAELAGAADPPRAARPVFAVALAGVPADPEIADAEIAEILRRLGPVIEGGVPGPGGAGAEADEAAVLVVDPSEVPAVRAHLGRGVRPPGRSLFGRSAGRS